jgi:menaquinone-dependent protoporphyrinogen IX oxidase
MNKDIIIYGTMSGTTEETALNMKAAAGKGVDVFNIKKKPAFDLNQYNRIFIGSGVYAGRLAADIAKFIEANGAILKTKNVVLFIHGFGPASEHQDIVKNSIAGYLPDNYQVYCLGGKVNYKRLNFLIRMMIKMITKKLQLDPKNPNNIDHQKMNELIKLISAAS